MTGPSIAVSPSVREFWVIYNPVDKMGYSQTLGGLTSRSDIWHRFDSRHLRDAISIVEDYKNPRIGNVSIDLEIHRMVTEPAVATSRDTVPTSIHHPWFEAWCSRRYCGEPMRQLREVMKKHQSVGEFPRWFIYARTLAPIRSLIDNIKTYAFGKYVFYTDYDDFIIGSLSLSVYRSGEIK